MSSNYPDQPYFSNPAYAGLDGVREGVSRGDTFGPSVWIDITQKRIDAFAEATGDRQWIHTDPIKAEQGPYGCTVAHGFLTLSLIPALSYDLFAVSWIRARVNYGLNKVRFPAPVLVETRLRGTGKLAGADEHKQGLVVTVEWTIEDELSKDDRPVCVAETLTLLVK